MRSKIRNFMDDDGFQSALDDFDNFVSNYETTRREKPRETTQDGHELLREYNDRKGGKTSSTSVFSDYNSSTFESDKSKRKSQSDRPSLLGRHTEFLSVFDSESDDDYEDARSFLRGDNRTDNEKASSIRYQKYGTAKLDSKGSDWRADKSYTDPLKKDRPTSKYKTDPLDEYKTSSLKSDRIFGDKYTKDKPSTRYKADPPDASKGDEGMFFKAKRNSSQFNANPTSRNSLLDELFSKRSSFGREFDTFEEEAKRHWDSLKKRDFLDDDDEHEWPSWTKHGGSASFDFGRPGRYDTPDENKAKRGSRHYSYSDEIESEYSKYEPRETSTEYSPRKERYSEYAPAEHRYNRCDTDSKDDTRKTDIPYDNTKQYSRFAQKEKTHHDSDSSSHNTAQSKSEAKPERKRQTITERYKEWYKENDTETDTPGIIARDIETDCQYTCHQKCRELVTLDCRASPDRKSPEKSSSNTEETSLNGDGTKEKSPLHVDEDHFAFYSTARESLPGMRPIPLRPDPSLSTQSNKIEDDNDSGYATAKETLPGMPEPLIRQPSADTLTREDLRRRIDQFNRNKHGLQIEMHEGETNKNTFRGVIRVHMSLIRPINMSLAERPPSIYEVLTHELENEADMNTAERRKNRTTSFYLPKDTMKALHIDSDTTTREVITTLLSKFKITDNPRKFVLYEHTLEIDDKKVIVRKLHDDEQPLKLYLDWSEEILNRKKLVLQENDSGEIQWDAFSLPELNNFLRILELEEREYKEQLKAKFQLLRLQMQMRHKELTQLKREQDRQVFV